MTMPEHIFGTLTESKLSWRQEMVIVFKERQDTPAHRKSSPSQGLDLISLHTNLRVLWGPCPSPHTEEHGGG